MKFGIFAPGNIVGFDQLVLFIDKAELSGFDGVFFFDHLWPHNHPEKPALDSLISTVTALSVSETLLSGPLALRVTMRGVKETIAKTSTIESIFGKRFICTIGAGDIKSIQEDFFVPSVELNFENRIGALRSVIEVLSKRIPNLWLGGSASTIINLSSELNLGLNLWDKDIEFIKALPKNIKFSWSGPYASLINLHDNSPSRSIKSLIELGAEWIVIGWPPRLDQLSGLIGEMKQNYC